MIGTVSASGLNIIEEDLNITKMFEQDYQAVLTIKNEENFKFQDIGFEEDFVSMSQLSLEPGQNATITAIISKNEDFDGTLTLRGDYEANLGESNKTIEVDIDFTYGLSLCNMDLIVGDKIQWNNKVLDEIILTGNEDFATILEGSNYTKTFNYVEEFDYYAKRNAGKFTEECRINVQNANGLGHSLAYDDKINVNIKINYEPTTITTNFLETEYKIEYDKEKEDIFSIKNTGNTTGHKINLESEWIEFDKNNFDLLPGESKTIKYTIAPLIYLTNQTNKTYGIDIAITGNFDKITQEIKIEVPYASVDSKYTSSASDPEFFHNLYYFFCDLFPEDTVCIKTSSSSGKVTTIEYSQETISGLLNKETKRQDEQTLFQKQQLELNQKTMEELNSTKEELRSIREGQDESNNGYENLATSIYFILGFLLLGAFIVFILQNKGIIKDKTDSSAKYEEGELKF